MSLLVEPVRCVDGHVDASDRRGLGADPAAGVVTRYAHRAGQGRPFDLT